MTRTVTVGNVAIGGGRPLALIAGPCVIEGRRECVAVARRLARWAGSAQVPFIFKASYDKANRTSHLSARGPGLSKGLEILREIQERFGVPVLTDVHSDAEVSLAATVADMLQCPAFLCRQTDLLLALGACGKPVNIKKGQFLAPGDMRHAIAKVAGAGNRRIVVTERGVSFGYNNLVVDMRSLPLMRAFGYPVVFDATHSTQFPGGAGDRSGGDARMAEVLAAAAVAAGCDALFIETHPDPRRALSDKDTMIPLARLPRLWERLARIDAAARKGAS